MGLRGSFCLNGALYRVIPEPPPGTAHALFSPMISALITSDLSGLTHRGAQGWTFTAKSSVTGHKEKSGQSFALQQVEETKKPADANQRN